MYVYFDKNGDIKAITPNATEMYSGIYKHIMLPLEQVEDFITGKKNTFDYVIRAIKLLGAETFKLTRKHSNITIARSLDVYLTEVKTKSVSEPIIKIVTNISQKLITVTLNQAFKDLYTEGTSEDIGKIDDFFNTGPSAIYITEKNNPYNLYTKINFTPRTLFDSLNISVPTPDHVDLRNSSAYTKRLVESYCYIVKD